MTSQPIAAASNDDDINVMYESPDLHAREAYQQ